MAIVLSEWTRDSERSSPWLTIMIPFSVSILDFLLQLTRTGTGTATGTYEYRRSRSYEWSIMLSCRSFNLQAPSHFPLVWGETPNAQFTRGFLSLNNWQRIRKSLSVKVFFAYILPILLADISIVHPKFGANRDRNKLAKQLPSDRSYFELIVLSIFADILNARPSFLMSITKRWK